MQMQRWTETKSDSAGCIDLVKPVVIASTIPLMDKDCPTAVLQCEMDVRGWDPVQHRVLHDAAAHPDEHHPYDAREPIQRRYYFQCCLSWDRITDLVDDMPSDQPQLYYRLLLAGRAVDPGLGNTEYKRLWAEADEPLALLDGASDEEFLALEPPPPRPVPLPLPPIPQPGSSVDPPPPPPPVLFLAPRRARRHGSPTPGTPPVDGGGDGGTPPGTPPDGSAPPIADDPLDEPPAAPPGPFLARAPPLKWRYTLDDGSRLRRDHYQVTAGCTYKHWVMTCNQHANCKNNRGV